MYQQHTRSWTKHLDFMLIDLACLQLCFMLSYWLNVDFENPYESQRYQYLAIVLTSSQILVMFFSSNYEGILRRKRFDELVAVLSYSLSVLVVALVYLFLMHHVGSVSRLQMGFSMLFYLVLDYLLRELNKMRLFRTGSGREKSVVLITTESVVERVMERIRNSGTYRDYRISEIILVDGSGASDYEDIPVVPLSRETVSFMSRGWVDEVLVVQPEGVVLPELLLNDLIEMGITVNYAPPVLSAAYWPSVELREIGGFKVLTGSIRFVSAGQLAMKRIADVAGGFIGCILTGILFIFVAPAIYAKSPGPVFFAQERVGRNGKTFKMYKFRSMRLDAEQQKAELLDQNKIEDGMMFKMDDDPRVIGSEKKRKDGRPGGIGNFIRRTSIDEFPQFFNVLKGDMSLVGTRPPTIDEWEKYELAHRVRMNMKPGITGMWQVSGRSQITNFEEVVRLDRKYIEEWSLLLDVKILLKTVVVVFKRKGAS